MSFKSAVTEAKREVEKPTGKVVKFYAWIDGGVNMRPSETTHHISGGQRYRDSDGRVAPMNYVEIKFNRGLYQTDDPDIISELRKMILKGETMTEDVEVYTSMVEPAERRALRLAARASVLTTELEQKENEIKRLQALLNNRGGKAVGAGDTE